MKKDDCIFCKLANGDIPVEPVFEDDVVKVIFDASPASTGHMLIIPKEHVANIYELDDELAAHIFKIASRLAKALKAVFDYDGLNVLQNNGEAAGQTVFHFHMHLIPRFEGDGVKVCWNHKEPDADKLSELREKISKEITNG